MTSSGNEYLERVRSRRNRRRWSRRASTAAWVLAGLALLGIWRFFPDLSDSTTTTAEGGPTILDELDDLTIEDLDEISLEEISLDDLSLDDAKTEFPDPVLTEVIDGWSLPLPAVDPGRAGRPHHDYPAWDYGVGVGTDLYAMTSGWVAAAIDDDNARCGGTVTVTTDDDAHFTYCHLSLVAVERGDLVEAGDFIGLSGGEPGTPGAGNTTGPHLHLQIRYDGQLRCPQDQLLALIAGAPVPIDQLTTAGCVRGQSSRAGIADSTSSTDPTDERDEFIEWD